MENTSQLLWTDIKPATIIEAMSYSSTSDHRTMTFDARRNTAYLRALEKVVGPDTTVMDLGAGLGVHGLSAARLGAAKVYMVDPSPAVEVARKVAADNQLDNIECYCSRVEELPVQAKVDVIVSVFTGNFLLTEDLLPSLFYARDRHLAPGGKLIPDRARMEVVPVTAPDYYTDHVDIWSRYPEHAAECGVPALDYGAARCFAANTLYYDTAEYFKASPLAAPTTLMELDFSCATTASCDCSFEVEVGDAGLCHGWLGWFQIHLLDEWLSTAADAQETHWGQVFLPLEQPLPVNAGDKLQFALQRPEFGEWTWTTRHGDQAQRLSTFFSQPLTTGRLRRASDNYQPSISNRGRAARWLLERMKGHIAVPDLADELRGAFPGEFGNDAAALKFVRDLAERYS